VFPIASPLDVPHCLGVDLLEGERQSRVEISCLLLGFPEPPAVRRDDLGSESVFLLREHDANLSAPAEAAFQLLQALLRECLKVRRHRHIPSREFDGHVSS